MRRSRVQFSLAAPFYEKHAFAINHLASFEKLHL